MPVRMDIILHTQTNDPALTFQNLSVFPDGSEGECLLIVRSGWLSASFPFRFSVRELLQFVSDLEALNETLDGTAVLRPQWEDHRLILSGNRRGGIEVSGELIDYAELSQRVSFRFLTDQTCLSPLISDFRAFIRVA